MALTKIGKEGITGVSNSADATFLTATSGEGVTLAGTLAVTGVHTVGNNAVATSEGGSATINVTQGLHKAWCSGGNNASPTNTLNISGGTDRGTGAYTYTYSSNLSDADIAGAGVSTDNTDQNLTIFSPTTSTYLIDVYNQAGSRVDRSNRTVICGDLA